MSHPLIGKVVRYSGGSTALFKVESANPVHMGNNVIYNLYGTHILGGLHAAYEDTVGSASQEDIALWHERNKPDLANTWYDLISEAVTEAEKAMVKFPQPNYVITKIAEESGEVVKEAVHCSEGRGDYSNLRSEMKQTIAMLYRLWVEGDEVHGCKPVGEHT